MVIDTAWNTTYAWWSINKEEKQIYSSKGHESSSFFAKANPVNAA